MSDIFISYRREDSEGWTGHLADRLQQAFGKNSVFYDYDSIEPSRDWKQAIEKGLRQCKLLIVVIGPKWVTATDVNGIRRLEDPADLVRLELSAAFQKHIPILPVLVGKAQLPKSVDLPGDLQDILKYQAFELPSRNWGQAIESLTGLVAQVTRNRRKQSADHTTLIDVGSGLVIDNTEAGSLVGIRDAQVPDEIRQVRVGQGAVIRNSKIGDIVGTETTGSRKPKSC